MLIKTWRLWVHEKQGIPFPPKIFFKGVPIPEQDLDLVTSESEVIHHFDKAHGNHQDHMSGH